MYCQVYASRRRTETYLWVTGPGVLDSLPDALRDMLGELRQVLEIELEASRRLPHQDTAQVLADLDAQGWHLQLPPGEGTRRTP